MSKLFGCIDNVKISNGLLTITGWSISNDDEIPKYYLISWGSHQKRVDDFDKIKRPDVARHLRINNTECGFRLVVDWSDIVLDSKLIVKASYISEPALHVLSITPSADKCIKSILDIPDNSSKLKLNLTQENTNSSDSKFIEGYGYKVQEIIKPGKVYKAIKDDRVYIIKKHATNAEIDKYIELYRKWDSDKSEYRQLYLPRFVEKLNEYHVVEYIDGIQIDWSETSNQPGYGGAGISLATIPIIIDLAFDAAKLNVHSDFYWRNFIFKNNCVALVDWELGNFRSASQASLLAYIYLLMFNNKEWQREFINAIRKSNLISSEDFKSRLLTYYETFLHQWAQYPYLLEILRKERSLINSEIGFNKIWQGYDIASLLESVKYHVFEELGQFHELDSQIDCKGKLNKLGLDRFCFSNKTVLDIGCNSGWFMKEFVSLGATEVVGLELEKSACQIAEKILLDVFEYNNCKIMCGNIMSYEYNEFDFVASISMFHYIEDKKSFFLKVSKLTKDHGVFLLETPVHDGDGVVIWDMVPKRYIPSITLIESYAKSSGFEIEHFGHSNLSDRRVFHFKKIASANSF